MEVTMKTVVNLADVRYYHSLSEKKQKKYLDYVYEGEDTSCFLQAADMVASGMTDFQIRREEEKNG